jgi:hypothetical protein
MKMFRGIVFKILGGVLVLTIIVIWAGATFYWGSCKSPLRETVMS